MSTGLDRAYSNLFATLLMVAFVLLMAYAVLTLLPEQIELVPEQDCVTVALPDRGLPPCEGLRPGSANL